MLKRIFSTGYQGLSLKGRGSHKGFWLMGIFIFAVSMNPPLSNGSQRMIPQDLSVESNKCNHYPPGSLARALCENSGNHTNTNCVRKCLRETYSGSSEKAPPLYDPWYWRDHSLCYFEYGWTPLDLIYHNEQNQ